MEQYELDFLNQWKEELQIQKELIHEELSTLAKNPHILNLRKQIIEDVISVNKELHHDSEEFRQFFDYDKTLEEIKEYQLTVTEKVEYLNKELKYTNYLLRYIEFRLKNRV
ncbi:hypothetical protein V1499_09845 [Neobacillus sp. SCS-31]|uniref:hypothetical protein n=1 Tax=Neobacillus oceani TaxID=3115292 RepID=UPI0039061557